MKYLRNAILTLLSATVLIGALAGCSASSGGNGYNNGISSDMVTDAIGSTMGGWNGVSQGSSIELGSPTEPEVSEDSGSSDEVYQSELRIIKTGSLEIESSRFDDTDALIRETVEQMGGLVTDRTIYGSDGDRYGSYTVRIPSDSFDQFFNDIAGSCTVTRQEISSEDVTEQYVDLETRLETNQRKYERLLELLDQAETLTDIYSIQSELSDVEYEINSITGTLNGLDSRISYSTITISLEETKSETVIDNTSFGTKVRASFENGLASFMENAELFVIDLAYILPGILVWVAVIGLISFGIYKLVMAVRKAKKERMEKAQMAWDRKQAEKQENSQESPKE